MTDAQIRELLPQPSVAVRIQAPMADLDLGSLFDEHLPNIADGIADRGGQPAGPPYGRYHQWGSEVADVEIGIPVAVPIGDFRPLAQCEPGEMGASQLPGGPAAVAVHVGSYEGLSATYGGLEAWIDDQERMPAAGPWESYVDDHSEVSTDDLRTEVIWPLT